jgi:hypothetical protein
MSGAYWDDYTGTSGKNSGPILGYPTTDPIECNGTQLVLLEGGEQSPGAMVTAASSGGFIWIPKLIWSRYRMLEGPFGRLGRPVGRVEQTPSETRQTFEHGYIRVVAGATKTDLEDRGGQESSSFGKLDACLK